MLKRILVVMLPTNEKAPIIKQLDIKHHLVHTPKFDWPLTIHWKYQHLYFLSDEEIKQGDRYLAYDNTICERYASIPLEGSKKIIATTDTSLEHEISIEGMPAQVPLPQPSQSFLEVFVTEYNKGNQIKEVLVEYVDNGEEEWLGDNETGQPFWNEKIELKVNPKDNTITIKKVKDSWSREEVTDRIIKVLNDSTYAKYSSFDLRQKAEFVDKWIEQNL
jgi:hypothetical protein